MTLIKNELYKLFHKRSTKIFIIIAIVYVILTNVLYRTLDDNFINSYNYYEDITTALKYVDDYENENIGESSMYNYYKSYVETYNLASNYASDSWQYQKYMEEYWNVLRDYYDNLTYGNDNTQTNQLLNTIKENIESANWQYFVRQDIAELNEEIDYNRTLLNDDTITTNKVEIEKQVFVAEEQIKLNQYRLDENVAYGNDYLNIAIDNISNSLYNLAEYNYANDKSNYEEDVKIYHENWYVLNEKVNTINDDSVRMVFINFFSEYSFLILVFSIMIAGAMVSDEFSKGTIKSLLITPHKRSKILLTKYISVIIMILLLIGLLIVTELLFGGILLGFSGLSIPVVVYNITTANLEIMNVFSYLGLYILTNLPQIILLATLAFACSVIINSTAFAIVLPFCGILGAEIINQFALVYDIKILNYFVTTNWDFTQYLFGGTSIFGNSLPHAIIVCLIYLLIMLVVSFIVFIKKDVKNI